MKNVEYLQQKLLSGDQRLFGIFLLRCLLAHFFLTIFMGNQSEPKELMKQRAAQTHLNVKLSNHKSGQTFTGSMYKWVFV